MANVKSILKSNKFQWGLCAVIWLSMPFSVPAIAQVVQNVSFSAPPRAVHVALPTDPGVSRFMVATNAPFYVTSSDVLGDIEVRVITNGTVNGNAFGTKAQTPGAPSQCHTAQNKSESLIYAAERKTAREPGEVIDQAVLVEVFYPKFTTPNIQIIAGKAPRSLTVGPMCKGANS